MGFFTRKHSQDDIDRLDREVMLLKTKIDSLESQVHTQRTAFMSLRGWVYRKYGMNEDTEPQEINNRAPNMIF